MNQHIKRWVAIALLSFPVSTFAQHPADVKAIESLCGCFEVQFNFAETFSSVKGYEYRDRYEAKAKEYIFVDEHSSDKLVLQHLLIINDSTVIKHWRQDWEYQQGRIFVYEGNNKWSFKKVPLQQLEGTWTQKVFEVTDAPRYSAAAKWVHSAEFPYWEAVANAPLPRREYTKRNDYHILQRNNRHEITATGHIHDQDNAKIVVAADGSHSTLVFEKGFVTYKRIDDQECNIARDWWEQNKEFWRISRVVWDEVLSDGNQIEMAIKVDGKMYHEALKSLAFSAPSDPDALKAALQELVNQYVTVTGKL
jgi:hypothetical protein